MPPSLLQGPGSVRKNVAQLMNAAPRSKSRKRAILTLAKKHNISRKDAQFRQAVAIAKSQARKK